METLVKKIKKCLKKDKASIPEYLAYLVEEVGEVATCISVKSNLKNKKLTEEIEHECCDIIVVALALIFKANPNWTLEDVVSYMSKKTDRWESRLK